MMHLRFRGDLVESPEVKTDEFVFGFWAHRYHFSSNTTDWEADVVTVAEAMRSHWITYVDKGNFSSAVNMKAAQCYHLDTAKKTLNLGEAAFDDENTWNGTAASGLPWEAALAVTLWGYTPGQFTPNKGRKRNRFYLPPLAGTVMTTYSGKITDTARTALTGDMSDLLNHIQGTEIGGTDTPGLNRDYVDLVALSTGDSAPPTGPPRPTLITQISTIGIGNVVDSQRRRRNKQVESYSSADIEHAHPLDG